MRVAAPTRRARLAYSDAERRDSAHFAETAWWESTRALAPRLAATPARDDVIAVPPVPGQTLAMICAQARAAGALLCVYTVDPDVLLLGAAAIGCDLITTNRPARMAALRRDGLLRTAVR